MKNKFAAVSILALAAVGIWWIGGSGKKVWKLQTNHEQSGLPTEQGAPVDSEQEETAPKGASEPMNPEKFQALISQIGGGLPTRESLRKLSEEDVHGTPDLIAEAGLALGKIARVIQENPDLSQQGAEFYGDCASREDLPNSIRALCYSNFKYLAKRLAIGLEEGPVSEEVKALSRRSTPSFDELE